MNREVKFREKRKDINVWAYGDLLHNNDGSASIRTNLNTWRENHDDVDAYGDNLSVDIDTVGQFTGLYDKNKKEIYEGDIVKAPLLDPIFGDVIKDAFCNAEIRFNKGSFVVSYYKREHNIYLSDLYKRIEVIGNIFDNKELLED